MKFNKISLQKKDEILIRPRCNIKSRHWWQKKIKRLKLILKNKITDNQNKKLVKIARFTLLITNNKEIQYLNKTFRKKNKPTDVLSFYLNKKDQLDYKYLGDIAISIKKAFEQSQSKKNTLENELNMLLVHGYLHLLGYDHKLNTDSKIMFTLQNAILKKLNTA